MASKLIRNYFPELLALGFRRPGPAMVTVNITDRCNQQCIYCEIGKGIPSGQTGRLSKDDLFWIIDEMDRNAIRKLSLCGGEPFLFEGLAEVVAYAGEKRIRCSVTTNGMTVFKCTGKELDIFKNYKTEFNISIDSMDDQVQAFIRGVPSALPKALRSVRVVQDNNIPVTVLCAVSKYNFHDLLPFLVSLHDLGVRQVLFQPIISFSNYPDRKAIHHKPELNVSLDQIEYLCRQLRAILQFEKNHRIRTNVYRILPWIRPYLETAAGQNGRRFFQNVLPAFHCREIYAIIDIAYDGGIQPCGLRPASVSIHGDRNQGLPALWKKATEGIRDDMEHGRYYPECNGCCHHFSRNMLASMVKYPIRNRKAWIEMTPLLLGRVRWDMLKKLHLSGIE